jgi:hypothetical protein
MALPVPDGAKAPAPEADATGVTSAQYPAPAAPGEKLEPHDYYTACNMLADCRRELAAEKEKKRPYSDKLAQEVIAEQVKDIDRLHRELAAARQRLDWTIEDNAKKAVRIADMEAAQSATATPWVVDCLRLAIRQNSHDMLLTGDEIRRCEAALAAADNRSADKGQG